MHFPLKCCAGGLKRVEPLTYIANLRGYDFWIMQIYDMLLGQFLTCQVKSRGPMLTRLCQTLSLLLKFIFTEIFKADFTDFHRILARVQVMCKSCRMYMTIWCQVWTFVSSKACLLYKTPRHYTSSKQSMYNVQLYGSPVHPRLKIANSGRRPCRKGLTSVFAYTLPPSLSLHSTDCN